MIQIGRQLFEEDKDMRVYHSPAKLAEAVVGGFAGMPTDSPLVQALLEIEGIEYAEVHPYYLAIKKARMFQWTSIELSLKNLISTFALGVEEVLKPSKQAE